MPLDLATVGRLARQIALPDVGTSGQERICAADVALVGSDTAIETAARYLAGAGVRRFRIIAAAGGARVAAAIRRTSPTSAARAITWPADGAAWIAALEGATAIVRSGLDDDPMLRAAVKLGVPAVIVRGRRDGVDVVSFRAHGPCPHAALDVPARGAGAAPEEAAEAALAGTLAAAEVSWVLARPKEPPRARHLRLSPDGPPLAQEIPWSPECFACGGAGREAVPA